MSAKTVIVCDDHPLFRSGVVSCLNEISELSVVAEASDVESGIAKLQIYEPNFLLCDLSMLGKSGFELIEWAQKYMPSTRIIVLSMHTELAFVQKAKTLGAIGFLAKEDAESELFHAIKQEPGGFYTSESIGRTNENLLFLETKIDPISIEFAKVSAAEMRVLALLSKSMTNKAMAESLNISPRTIEAHRSNLSEKLDAKGPNKLLELAIRYRKILQDKI